MRKPIPWFIFLTGWSLFLSGCSSLKMAYDYGPTLAIWQIDEYFDTTSEQEELLKPMLVGHLNWHRQEELPAYQALLEKVAVAGQDQLTAEDIDEFLTQFEGHRSIMIDRLLPDTARLITLISPEQAKFFQAKAEEENDELRERLQLPLEEQQEERYERWLENLEEWFGNFSSEQLAQLETWYAEEYLNGNPTQRRLERRLRFQQEFVELIQTRPEVAESKEWLRNWVQDQIDQAEQSGGEGWKQRTRRRLLYLDQLITSEQRSHALERLQEYIDQIHQITLS